MFAVLGEQLGFEVLGWQSHEISSGVDWAQHALIGGKPRLEPVAQKLTQIRLRLAFHRYFDDPVWQAQQLRAARDARLPMALVFESGDYLGRFVITDLTESPRSALGDGDWIEAEFGVSLLEFVGALPQVLPPAVRDPRAPVRSVFALSGEDGGGALFGGSALGMLAGSAGRYLASASGGLAMARTALDAVRQLGSNPAAALGRLVTVAAPLAQAVPALQGLGDVLGQAGPYLSDAARLAGQVAQTARSAQAALGAVRAGGLGALAARVELACNVVNGATRVLAGGRATVARMALNSVLRVW